MRVPEKGLRLPERMRGELVMPFGKLVDEKTMLERAKRCNQLVTVGDVVSLRMLENGIVPKTMVYDLSTRRESMSSLSSALASVRGNDVMVRNPAGRIMPEMVKAIETSFASKEITKLRVEGEEDLAALVCAAVAPDGTCVAYGLPGKGVVFVNVDDEVRRKAKTLIGRMEESD
ncbi:MAG: DUF359 domain-containing protein [Methanomassiliicoccales archaeon]|nr:DUF359 domain-containing protein [Methanomassiliicoccales archaeon]